jgi:hypothetical protein
MCVWHDMHRELTVNGHLREVQIVEASKDMDVPYNFYVAFSLGKDGTYRCVRR